MPIGKRLPSCRDHRELKNLRTVTALGTRAFQGSKSDVVSWSDALAEELRGIGLKVSCLAPGPRVAGWLGSWVAG